MEHQSGVVAQIPELGILANLAPMRSGNRVALALSSYCISGAQPENRPRPVARKLQAFVGVGDMKLIREVRDVGFYGATSDAQIVRDGLIPLPLHQEVENLRFARCDKGCIRKRYTLYCIAAMLAGMFKLGHRLKRFCE